MRELFPTILTMAVVAFVLGIGLDSVPKTSQAHHARSVCGSDEGA